MHYSIRLVLLLFENHVITTILADVRRNPKPNGKVVSHLSKNTHVRVVETKKTGSKKLQNIFLLLYLISYQRSKYIFLRKKTDTEKRCGQ